MGLYFSYWKEVINMSRCYQYDSSLIYYRYIDRDMSFFVHTPTQTDAMRLSDSLSNRSNLTEWLAEPTEEVPDGSSTGAIITIIILSFLSIFGWIFMSYALFGRSEAYRIKPDDHFAISPHIDSCPRPQRSETGPELHVI